MKCPKCNSKGPFDIECKSTFTVYDDGTDPEYTGLEWDNGSACSCGKCYYEGIVMYFVISNPDFGVH